jgi:arylsulfatase A-like enzyme
MKPIRIIVSKAVSLALVVCTNAFAAPTELPNIVIIMPDDLGSRDVSFRGGAIATPHIDRIAAEGVTFDRFYTAPVCSPTRAGLMTGRYPIRFGLMRAVIAAWRDFGLDTNEVTLAEVLAKAGYTHRAIFGKWHLGHHKKRWHPLRRGFTEFKGYNAAIDFFTHENIFLGERDWWHDYDSVDEPGYLTDLHAEHTVQFINAHAKEDAPFFAYVPFSAPHSPLQAKEEDLPLYEHLDALPAPRGWEESTAGRPLRDEARRRAGRRIHGAMVHALDVGVGRILQALEDNGVADNTLVLFFSDNGGSVGIGDNAPFKGAKGSVFEGGIRVVAAARWPAGDITGGRVVKTPVQYVDVLPTLMGITGVEDHGGEPLDGLDLSGIIRGSEPDVPPERTLFSFIAQLDPEREQVSVTQGDWKLVVIGPPLTRSGSVDASRKLLYRVTADSLEERDVAARFPDVTAQLLAKAVEFRALQPAEHVAPFFDGRESFEPPRNWDFEVE